MLKKIPLFSLLILVLCSCEKSKTELADELFNSGSYQEAITSYTTYLKDHPADEKSLYNRGRAYEELGNLDKALKDFREAVSVAPENLQLRQSLGLCYYKLDQFNSTINAMDDLLEKKPNDSEAFYLKGRALQRLGKVNSAIENYSNAIRYNPRHAESHLYRGNLFIITKKADKGCRDLRKANALGSEEADKLIAKHCK